MTLKNLFLILFLVAIVGCFFDQKTNDEICLTDHIYQEIEESLIKDDVQTTAVTNKYKHWPKGDTLKIFFIGTPENEITQVLKALEIWGVQIVGWSTPSNVTPIDLYATRVLDRNKSTVRYQKSTNGASWAYVGRTHNFGKNVTTIHSTLYSAPHEWGHVLGRSHEHQNGMDAIVWNKEYVYEYMAKRGWNKAKVDHNFFTVYVQDDNHDVDPVRDLNSVMHYRFPKEFVMPESQNKLPTKSVRYPSNRDTEKAVEDYPIGQAPPDPVDCVLGPWSEWSVCDKECDGGKQQRTREVVTPSENGGEACGVLVEYRDCNTDPCPIDPPVTVDKEMIAFAVKYFIERNVDIYRLRKDVKLKILRDLYDIDTEGMTNSQSSSILKKKLDLSR